MFIDGTASKGSSRLPSCPAEGSNFRPRTIGTIGAGPKGRLPPAYRFGCIKRPASSHTYGEVPDPRRYCATSEPVPSRQLCSVHRQSCSRTLAAGSRRSCRTVMATTYDKRKGLSRRSWRRATRTWSWRRRTQARTVFGGRGYAFGHKSRSWFCCADFLRTSYGMPDLHAFALSLDETTG